MSQADGQHQELLDAARALALHLGCIEEDEEARILIDLGEYDEDGARETIEDMMDAEDELVDAFGGDLDLAIKYVELVLDDARSRD